MVGLSRSGLWLLAVALLLGAGAPRAEVTSTPVQKTILLVRHAEKCHEQGENPSLSEAGARRAQALARVLQDIPIQAIYSTPFRRTMDTVTPIADSRGLEIRRTPVEEGFLEALAVRLQGSEARVALVSGHSNTVPRLVNLLAGTDYEDLAESDYDRIFVVTLDGEGEANVLVLRYGEPSSTEPGC